MTVVYVVPFIPGQPVKGKVVCSGPQAVVPDVPTTGVLLALPDAPDVLVAEDEVVDVLRVPTVTTKGADDVPEPPRRSACCRHYVLAFWTAREPPPTAAATRSAMMATRPSVTTRRPRTVRSRGYSWGGG